MSPNQPNRGRPSPSGPGHEDPAAGLERQRALTAEFRDALDAFAEDAREIVRDEVSRAAPDAAVLEDMVRRVARDELRAWESRRRQSVSWATVATASALALVASGTAWGIARWAGGGPRAPVPVPVQVAVPADTPDPAPDGPALAARFDSLFASRDSSLVALAERAVSMSGPGVSAAAASWRAGEATGDRLLHDALVQLALREVADSAVMVDGRVMRAPSCTGQSCTALLAHWQRRAGTAGYPELPADPASDSAGLALVERLLVMELIRS